MVRIARIGAGLGLIVLGMFLLVLPGPGILTIAGGLALLSKEFEWARNVLDWMRRRYRSYFTKGQDDEGAPEGAPDERVS